MRTHLRSFLLLSAGSGLLGAATSIASCATSQVVDVPDSFVPPYDATGPCTTPYAMCGNTCVDPQRDNGNCGACNQACKSGEICVSGKCALSCGGGATLCNGACTSLQADPNNCSKCGNACKPGEVCSKGSCALSCGSPTTPCAQDSGTFCLDLTTNDNNCGQCGTICEAGTSCQSGACAIACQDSLTNCNDKCVNLKFDPTNCGKCSGKCASQEVCSPDDAGVGTCGLSCLGGTTLCNFTTCKDTLIDRVNCGACDNICEGGAPCKGGKCL